MPSAENAGQTGGSRSAGIEGPDDIVISGMSIRCSQSDNIEEFAKNLYDGVNMVHENLQRCDEDHFGVPKQHGFIKDIRKFDATFFGVHPKQAEGMDPQLRILHEVAYESIIDAGVDPAALKNSNTGVFIGTSNSDAREAWTSADVSEIDGYSLIGTHRAFLANRLSFTFDLRGPSFGVDAACATTGVAINQGYLHIKNKVCDAALVGGVSLVYQPKVSYQILKLGLLCKDGKCKVFDEAADGYVRAEAIVCIMLQRRKDAHRSYCTLLHSKINNDGFKEQGITFPSTESQGQLVTEVYEEAGVDPEDVEYVEAHGTGTSIGDPQETNGIALGFANTRTKPLPIGAVKSNMGHSEHASGGVSVCKILIAMQTGLIPPNLHYKTPNPLIPALVDGRLKVVTEAMKWNSTIAGVNCFGFGGQNSHVVLRGNPNVRTTSIHDERLVIYMGRTEEGAQAALEYFHRYPDNPYVPYLLMQSAHAKPAAMPYRGYTIINTKEPVSVVERVTTEQKPVWFVFSGQGTQWASMGREILRLPAFRESIEKCAKVLHPLGVDLIKILAESTEQDFEDPTLSFVGIAAIQVALVDLLNAMKITATGFVGHSAGEIGCAYADGGFSAEEAVLAAYWRGRAVKEAKLPQGSMAAVGLSWEEATKRCKGSVVPACNNSKDNVTVSGPADEVAKFVDEMKAQNIFAKEVKSYGVAFHSPAMKQAAPGYLNALKEVLVSPKMRTTRWVSTAVPESEWNTDLGRFASAEYFAHNLTNTVKFHEALVKIPNNAIVIEIAPHGLLQALVKQTVGINSLPVALMKRGHPNNLNFFLEAIGKLYVNGLNPHVVEIFPKPSLPAPRDTPFIGSICRWDHSAMWRIPYFTDFIHKGGKGGAQHNFTYDLSDPLNVHYLDHKVGSQAVFPVGGYLAMAAKAFATETGNTIEKSPRLIFSNIRFLTSVKVEPHASMQFSVNVTKSSGDFEISHGGELVVMGNIAATDLTPSAPASKSEQLTLKSEDVYEQFALRGYNYGPQYHLVKAANFAGTVGKISGGAGYENAVDGLVQLFTLSQNTRDLSLPTEIQSIVLDIPKLASGLAAGLTATVFPAMNIVSCEGAELEGIKLGCAKDLAPAPEHTVSENGFVPNNGKILHDSQELKNYADLCAQYLHSKASHHIGKGVKSDTLNGVVKNAGKQSQYNQDLFARYQADPNATLLKLISTTFEAVEVGHGWTTVDDTIRKTVATLRPTLKNDVLLSAITNRGVLQPVIDLALENVADDQVQVLELLRGDQPSKSQNITFDSQAKSVEVKTLSIKQGQQTEIYPSSASVLLVEDYFHGAKTLAGDLQTLSTILKDDGYLLVIQPFDGYVNEFSTFGTFSDQTQGAALPDYASFTRALTEAGFEVVLEKQDGVVNRLLLCRKVPAEPVRKHAHLRLSDKGTTKEHLEAVQKTLAKEFKDNESEATTRVWLVAPKGQTELSSIISQLSNETGGQSLRFIVDDSFSGVGLPAFDEKNPVYTDILAKDLKTNVFRNGEWGSIRYTPFSENAQTDTLTAVATPDPKSKSLQWSEGPVQNASGNTKTVAIAYALLNTQGDKFVGFSGHVIPSGEKVMGVVPSTPLSTHVAFRQEELVPVPQNMSMQDAASVPFTYDTAYYALNILARVLPGTSSVLVHASLTPDCEAIIRVALAQGLQVYISSGSEAISKHLAERLPQIKGRIFGSLHEMETAEEILALTYGHGVDVVYNPSSQNKLQESLRVMSPFASYLQYRAGKDQRTNVSGSAHKNVSVYLDIAESVSTVGTNYTDQSRQFFASNLANGKLVALPSEVVTSLQDIPKDRNAVVLQVRSTYPPQPIKAVRRAHFNPNKVYIVSGAEEALAVNIALWLSTQGARKIVLALSEKETNVLASHTRYFQSQRTDVTVATVARDNKDAAESLLRTASSRGPIGGVFHLNNVTYLPTGHAHGEHKSHKHLSVEQLDKATKSFKDFEYFVIITSDTNSESDSPNQLNPTKVIAQRVAAGLPGQVVHIGTLVPTVNDAATHTDNQIPLNSLFASLSSVLRSPAQSVSVAMVQSNKHHKRSLEDDESGPQDKAYLPQAVGKIMGIKDFASLDMFLSLGDYGIDSLMAMELGKILERDFDLSLTLQEIRALCIRDICLMSGATNAVEAAKFAESKTLNDVPTLLDTVKNHYNLNDLVPKSPIVLLRQMKENSDILFIVHPMEGTVLPVLESLANHLKVTTYGLNCGTHADLSSIEALATYYIQEIKKIQPSGPYNIAGYSFGAGVAFEMALQLQAEAKNNVRQLVLLDGSHSFVGAFTKTMKSGYTVDPNMPLEEMFARKQNAFEVAIFVLFVTQFVKTQRKQLSDKMTAANSFDERVEVAVQELHRCQAFNDVKVESIRAAAVAFAQRLMIADTYKPASKFDGPVTLIKCTEKMIRNLGELYELDKVCTQKDNLHAVTVPGNHEGFVLGESSRLTADHINKAVLRN